MRIPLRQATSSALFESDITIPASAIPGRIWTLSLMIEVMIFIYASFAAE